VGWVRWQTRVENCARKIGNNTAKYERETNVFKIECCGSFSQLPTKRMKQKVCRFLSEI
jgi:hypothetical protein